MAVTLGEEIMLLAFNEKSGSAKTPSATSWGVVAGTLLELALAGRVDIDDNRMIVLDRTPLEVPLLDKKLTQLVEWSRKRRRPRKASDWLMREHLGALKPVRKSLIERGIVAADRRTALGFIGYHRYPITDKALVQDIRDRLTAAVLHGEQPDEHTAGLVAILHATKLQRRAFPSIPVKDVKPRMIEISEGHWTGESVQQAIKTVQAVTVAVTAATVVTTTQ